VYSSQLLPTRHSREALSVLAALAEQPT